MVSVFLSVLIEYIIFAYYINSADNMKISKVTVNVITACAYAIYSVVCVFSPVPMVNVAMFFAVNVMLLCIGWKRSILFSILNGAVLTAFMMFSELLVGVVFDIDVGSSHSAMSQEELYVLVAFSKVIYFLCVAILGRFVSTKGEKVSVKEEAMFLLLPIATCVFFNAFAKIRLQVDTDGHLALIIVSLLLIAANVSVYLVYNMITNKNIRIRSLAADEHKKEMEYKSYELLKEKYEDLRSMIHDFEKYCNNIEGLLELDSDKAKAEIKYIRERNRALLLVERTNNKALNVILDQKMRECVAKGIEFRINIQNVDLSYINELDTVTVFSNLLDNAIECCSNAKVKTVELEVFVINDSYTALRIVNTCDTAPQVKNGQFVTGKKDKVSHGIGLKSVQRTLNLYGAKMKCSYEKETKTFCVTVLINNNEK